jgi:hypothetical protein
MPCTETLVATVLWSALITFCAVFFIATLRAPK